MPDDRIKVGIIGTGGIFHGWGDGTGHLPAYPWIVEEAKVAALCDVSARSLGKAERALKSLYAECADKRRSAGDASAADLLASDSDSVRLYTDVREMLENERLDLVDIASPCEYHLDAIKQSLEAGCHVMCEKPLAQTWLDAMEIVESARKSDKLFQYNENRVFADPYYDIRKLCQKQEIGELATIWMPASIGEPGNYAYLRGRVGSLLDMGIHAITTCWYIIGFDYIPTRVKALSPEGVSIRSRDRLTDAGFRTMTVEDDAHFAVEFEHPITGHWVTSYIEASWSHQDFADFRIVGSKGSIKLGARNSVDIEDVYGNIHAVHPFHASFHNMNPAPGYSGFPQEIKSMVGCVRDGVKPICDEVIGAESLAIAQAAYLSEARGRKAVSLDEFKDYALSFKQKHGNAASSELLNELLKGLAR